MAIAVGAAALGTCAVPARAAIVFPWTTTSAAVGQASIDVSGVSTLPDGSASVTTGSFQGAKVNLGDGVVRTSPAGGTAPAAFTQMIRSDGSIAWTRTSTSTDPAYSTVRGLGVSALPDGRSVITGLFRGTDIDLGDGVLRTTGNGALDASFTQMLRPDGSVAWTSTSSPQGQGTQARGTSVSVLPDGRSISAGGFTGVAVDLGDGVIRHSAANGARQAGFVQLRRADGSIAWTSTPSASGSGVVETTGVSALPDGRAIVTGSFGGTGVDLGDGVPRTSSDGGTENTVYTQMLRADGSLAWTTVAIGAGQLLSESFAVSAVPDRAFITGRFAGVGVDLGDGVPRTSAEHGDSASAFTQMLRPDGSVAWTTVTSGGRLQSDAEGLGLSAQRDGGVLVSGYFQGIDIDLADGVARTSPSDGGSPASFVQRLRPNGSVDWTSTSTAPGPSETASDGVNGLPDGSVVHAGFFQGVGINLGDGVLRTSPNGGIPQSSAAFTQKLISPPLAPDAPAVSVGDGRITAAVAPLAGGSITSYTARATPGGATCTVIPPATSCTITGRTNGVAYTVAATATNAAGNSASSPQSAPATPTATGISASVLAPRSRLVSGRNARLYVRVANRTASTASLRACLVMPRNVRLMRAVGGDRSGNTACFTIGTLRGKSTARRQVIVRPNSARRVMRVVTGRVSAPGMATVRVRPKALVILPAGELPGVTG